MPSIAGTCDNCNEPFNIEASGITQLSCTRCGDRTWNITPELDVFTQCTFCDCQHFFKQKDFNKVMGCGLVLLGAVLVPFTYGLSLLVLAVFDWIIYQRLPHIAVCYRCRTEYRGYDLPESIQGFNHWTGWATEKN